MSLQSFLSSPIGQLVATVVVAVVILGVFQKLFTSTPQVAAPEPTSNKPFSAVPKRDKPVATKEKKPKQVTSKKFSAKEEDKWAAPAESVIPQVSPINKPTDHRVKTAAPAAAKKKDAAVKKDAVASPVATSPITSPTKQAKGFEVVAGKKSKKQEQAAPAPVVETSPKDKAAAPAAPAQPNVFDLIFQSSNSRSSAPVFSAPRAPRADRQSPKMSPTVSAPAPAAAPAKPAQARPVQIAGGNSGQRGWAKLEEVVESPVE